jgi:hypothetical protein
MEGGTFQKRSVLRIFWMLVRIHYELEFENNQVLVFRAANWSEIP